LLTVEGFQVPVIAGAFVDDVGNVGAGLPLHNAGNAANVGTVLAVIVCTIVVVNAH
jgi:hypothetical protein